MCGIWAIFGSDEEVSKHVASCLSISHRGPDAFRIENVNHFKNCAFGFHRLAIMDDLEGMQPFRIHKFPHLWLCYNGEIYNYKLLAEQFGFKYECDFDGECILHLYSMGGAKYAASQLDGVFSFVILDVADRKVSIGRDTYGVRPSFRLSTDCGFLGICSEAKGLLNLAHGYDDKDVEISPFPPGHVSSYTLDQNGKASFNGDIAFHKTGDKPAYSTQLTRYSGKVRTDIKDLLSEAVRKRMMTHSRRIGCMLSGGLDSSLISSLVCQHAKEMNLPYKIQTFATGMAGSPDLLAARKVAKHLGTDHHEIIFTPEEGLDALKSVIYHNESYDITTTRASVGMFIVSKYISDKTDSTIIFSGEGADELCQGYIYFHKAPSAKEADAESRRLLSDLYLYDNLRADRTTAAHGLELRVPFLDHQLTSYILSLAPEQRQPKNGIEKHLLRSAFTDSGLIPHDILWRPKEAFSDGVSSQKKSWFKVLQEFIDEQITEDMLEKATETYEFNTPQTNEAYYYRQVFESFYPHKSSLIPYYWMPKWIEAKDPSARTLNHYQNSEVESKTDTIDQ